MRIIFTDTSAFAALFNIKDGYHNQAIKIFKKLSEQNAALVTTNIIRLETHALLLSKANRDLAMQFLEEQSWHVEWVTFEDENNALKLLKKNNDKNYSLTDAVSFVVMNRLSLNEAFTFDRHFQQYGFKVLE
ncbi:MAG: PIN domain-containing protein [Bacillota bacterium]|nr:PIN domain-containing protein [Bacillota bacterium]